MFTKVGWAFSTSEMQKLCLKIWVLTFNIYTSESAIFETGKHLISCHPVVVVGSGIFSSIPVVEHNRVVIAARCHIMNTAQAQTRNEQKSTYILPLATTQAAAGRMLSQSLEALATFESVTSRILQLRTGHLSKRKEVNKAAFATVHYFFRVHEM